LLLLIFLLLNIKSSLIMQRMYSVILYTSAFYKMVFPFLLGHQRDNGRKNRNEGLKYKWMSIGKYTSQWKIFPIKLYICCGFRNVLINKTTCFCCCQGLTQLHPVIIRQILYRLFLWSHGSSDGIITNETIRITNVPPLFINNRYHIPFAHFSVIENRIYKSLKI
jgi:hypothetical protein